MSQSIKLDNIKKSGKETPVDNTTLKVMLATISKQDSVIKAGEEVIKECISLNQASASIISKQKEQLTNREDNLVISNSLNSSLKYTNSSLEKENKKLNFKVKLFRTTTIVAPIVIGGAILYLKR